MTTLRIQIQIFQIQTYSEGKSFWREKAAWIDSLTVMSS